MTEVVAFGSLAMTVGLAIGRPRFGRRIVITPGLAALAGVVVLVTCGVVTPSIIADAMAVQWRPLVALASIMVMTGVVHEVGAFHRLAAAVEQRARAGTPARTFTMVFAVAACTAAVLNNDAAILLLTPFVISLGERLYPGQRAVITALAFAVFLAPGVAPFLVSNPMNMIVAEYAGIGFNAYARLMLPIAIVASLVTYVVARIAFRRTFAMATAPTGPVRRVRARPGERAAVGLMLGVFAAYPVVSACGGATWSVAVAGAIGSLVLARVFRIASAPSVVARHVSFDILVFLWGLFLLVQALGSAGVAHALTAAYQAAPAGTAAHLGLVGSLSALGSAVIDNHPMAMLNMLAIDKAHGIKPILAALIGGDIGPRLLPIGSLAGLLWIDLLRRRGLSIGVGQFVRLGTLVLLPTLAVSIGLLWLL